MTEQTPPHSIDEVDDDLHDLEHDEHDSPDGDGSHDSKPSAPIQKRRRVTRACDTCRGKKIKCDGKQPCTHCTVYSYDCTYDQPSNRRRNPAPQYIEALENRLARAEALLKTYNPNVDLNDPNLGNGMLPPLVQFPPQMPRRGTHANEDEEKGSVLQSMIDRTGSIDLDAEGRLDFYGSSSGRVFYERISRQMGTFDGQWNNFYGWNDYNKSEALLREKKRPFDSPRSADSPGDLDGVPNLHDLPSKEVGQALCECALDDAMSLLRFMHNPSFWRMFHRIYDIHSSNWTTEEHRYLPVVYATMALGTMFAKTEDSKLQIEGYEIAMENGFRYFKAATSMMDLTDIRDLHSLQAALLLTYFIQSSAKLSTCYSFVGICLFGALRMGMHRNCPGKFNKLENEMRKRAFWLIRKMDVFVAGTLGLPILLDDDDIDQEYPADCDDDCITADSIIHQPEGHITLMTGANAHSDLIRILNKILKTVYPVRSQAANGPQVAPIGVSYAKVREIEKNLQDWMESMPMGLRPGSGGNNDMVRLQHLLRMSYAHVQMVLYRPFLHYMTLQGQKNTGDQRFYACAAACVHVARNCIHIMSEMNRKHLLIGAYWFQMYTTFWAVLILVFYSVENSENKSPHEYFNAAVDGKDMLATMAKRSAAADRCNAVLQQLFSQLPERFQRGRQTSTSSSGGSMKKRQAQSQPRVELERPNSNPRNVARPVSGVFGAPPRASTMPQNHHNASVSSNTHKRTSLSNTSFIPSGHTPTDPFANSPSTYTPSSSNDPLTHSTTSPDVPSSPASTLNFTSGVGSAAGNVGANPAVHDLASMIFPSNDPFAYPNQPMTTFENQFGMESMNGTFDLSGEVAQIKTEPGTIGEYMQNMQGASQAGQSLGPSVPADFMTGDWIRGNDTTQPTQQPNGMATTNGLSNAQGQLLNEQGIDYDTLFSGGDMGLPNMNGPMWFQDGLAHREDSCVHMMAETATPRRRSARLQGNNNTPARSRTGTPAQKRLDSVLEQDDAHKTTTQSLSSVVANATPTGKKRMPGAFETDVEMKTPESVQQPKPTHEEMHPEHAHQHTVKVSNRGLELGFSDVNPYQSSPLRPTNHGDTLSPGPISHAKSSPGFEFSFSHDQNDLGNEAQRIMKSVREEAARIKEKLRQERDEQAQKDLEAEGITGRRIAKPKSRFSDVHEAEFSRMQSISDHLSSLKKKARSLNNSPVKEETPANASTTPSKIASVPRTPVKAGLKRSRSKVDLDTPEGNRSGMKSGVKRMQSRSLLQSPSPVKAASAAPPRPENDAVPAKRRKVDEKQDVSTARPASSAASVSPSKPLTPSVAATPTKASMARLQTAKNVQEKKSRFGISRSSSLKSITKPGTLRNASDKIASAVANKVSTVKSILHKPQPKYSDDPLKIAAGTHLPMPRPTPSTQDGTPSLPGTPHPKHTLPRPTPKRVEFAPDTKAAAENVVSPTPAKKPSIRLLSNLDDDDNVPPPDRSPVSKQPTVSYPSLPEPSKESFSSTNNSPRQKPSPRPPLNPLFSHPPTAGDFTFSHEKRIVFAGKQSSPKRPTPTPSNGTPTSIRRVRPSGMPTPIIQASHPSSTPGQAHIQKPLPAVPHGMTNKKRAREGDDSGGSDVENRDPNEGMISVTDDGSPRKRAKMAAGLDMKSRSNSPAKSPSTARLSPAKSSPLKTPRRQTGFGIGGPATTSPKKGLSLARINFLARPKERR